MSPAQLSFCFAELSTFLLSLLSLHASRILFVYRSVLLLLVILFFVVTSAVIALVRHFP